MNNNQYTSYRFQTYYILVLLILVFFPQNGKFQGSFIIRNVVHHADEWIIKEKSLGHSLSGQLLNRPGKATRYGTDLGNYVHRNDLDGSKGICVKLNQNGSWHKIRCQGPIYERLIDNKGGSFSSSKICVPCIYLLALFIKYLYIILSLGVKLLK